MYYAAVISIPALGIFHKYTNISATMPWPLSQLQLQHIKPIKINHTQTALHNIATAWQH